MTVLTKLIPQTLCLLIQRKALTQIFRGATRIHYHFLLFTLQRLCSYSYTGKTVLAEPSSAHRAYVSVNMLEFALKNEGINQIK